VQQRVWVGEIGRGKEIIAEIPVDERVEETEEGKNGDEEREKAQQRKHFQEKFLRFTFEKNKAHKTGCLARFLNERTDRQNYGKESGCWLDYIRRLIKTKKWMTEEWKKLIAYIRLTIVRQRKKKF
jgi:hypothetical protein